MFFGNYPTAASLPHIPDYVETACNEVKKGNESFFENILNGTQSGVNQLVAFRKHDLTIIEFIVYSGKSKLFSFFLEKGAIATLNQNIQSLKLMVAQSKSTEIDAVFVAYCRANEMDPEDCGNIPDQQPIAKACCAIQ